MKSECERVRPLLSPFLDGELPAVDAQAVRAHLAACAPCSVASARLGRLATMTSKVLLGALPAVHDSEWKTAWARIDGAGRQRPFLARVLGIEKRRAGPGAFRHYAVAALALFAATVTLPLLVGTIEGDHRGHLCFSRLKGGNAAEVVEVETDPDRYAVSVDYPRSDSNDPVVIMLSKL